MRLAVATLVLVMAAGCGGNDGASPEGSWRLAAGIDLAGAETVPTANFGDERVGGSTGCNRFNAPYAVDGDALELGPIATTQIGCEPDVAEIESAYLAVLGRVATWRLDERELVLLDDGGMELLRFTPT